jgi:hypothetical protein
MQIHTATSQHTSLLIPRYPFLNGINTQYRFWIETGTTHSQRAPKQKLMYSFFNKTINNWSEPKTKQTASIILLFQNTNEQDPQFGIPFSVHINLDGSIPPTVVRQFAEYPNHVFTSYQQEQILTFLQNNPDQTNNPTNQTNNPNNPTNLTNSDPTTNQTNSDPTTTPINWQPKPQILLDHELQESQAHHTTSNNTHHTTSPKAPKPPKSPKSPKLPKAHKASLQTRIFTAWMQRTQGHPFTTPEEYENHEWQILLQAGNTSPIPPKPTRRNWEFNRTIYTNILSPQAIQEALQPTHPDLFPGLLTILAELTQNCQLE